MPEKFDIVIAGSGFAGSIAALALHNSGFKVCLVEKESHPRFAIGESSTPVADMVLRSLADNYNLPFLRQLSRYGSWQEYYPELLCGIKRGFSYFSHQPGKFFHTDTNHSSELLVAASISDQNSDTNWYRPDIDAFLVRQVKDTGITYCDRTEITGARQEQGLHLTLKSSANGTGTSSHLQCELLIDATGSSKMASQLFGVKATAENFETNSFSLYSHFNGVRRWSNHIRDRGYAVEDYPYDPDHSALHHLVDEGWMWKLRFHNDLLSTGFVIDSNHEGHARLAGDKDRAWRFMMSRYPSLKACFEGSGLYEVPDELKQTGRMQRRLNRIYGENWVALNHTAGFVDPLHSTGIAHTLCGLERLVEIISESWNNKRELEMKFAHHQQIFFSELSLVDLLVAGCYKSRWYFELFHAFTMLYFVCTITYERERLAGKKPKYFLQAGDQDVQRIVRQSYEELKTLLKVPMPEGSVEPYTKRLKNRIAPYNTAGLLDREKRNMYEHTAVKL